MEGNATWNASTVEPLGLLAGSLAGNQTANLTLQEYIELKLGPKNLPMTVVWPLTIIYVIIFVTGVVGNVAVCVVIVRNASMHTATNYYLFSLAVSDLALLLLGLPYELGVYWQQYPYPFGEAVCKIRALVSEMTSYTSVLTIVAFSLERYLAICHPLHSYRMSGLRRAVKIIAVLWVVSFISALPFAALSTVVYLNWPEGSSTPVPESAFCLMKDTDLYMVIETSTLLFFLLPMLVMVAIYGRIGSKIRSRGRHSLGKRVEGVIHSENKQTQSRKAIIRMLSAVVIAFFLCWAPFHSQRLLFLYGRELPHYDEINAWLYYVTGCLYFFGSTVNPILYNLMSVKYRMAFKETLCCGLSASSVATRAFREQSSFRDTSVTQFGDGNGVKWQRGGNGAGPGSNRRCRPHRQPHIAPAAPIGATPLLENGGVLEPHWRDEPTAGAVEAADAAGVAVEAANNNAEDADGGSELVVMISPANRKPRVYAVGAVSKASRNWPKALMLRMARKQPAATENGAAPTTPQHETCI